MIDSLWQNECTAPHAVAPATSQGSLLIKFCEDNPNHAWPRSQVIHTPPSLLSGFVCGEVGMFYQQIVPNEQRVQRFHSSLRNLYQQPISPKNGRQNMVLFFHALERFVHATRAAENKKLIDRF
jgi:hypothetical protein